MKNIFIVSILTLIAFSSCRKEDTIKITNGLPRMEEALVVLNGDKNGAIRISAQKTFDMQSVSGQKNLWEVWGKFWGDDNVTQKYGALSIDSFVLAPETSGVYQSKAMLNNPDLGPLFGKTVGFLVNKGDTERTVVLQSSLYVPADITVSAPVKTVANQVLPLNTTIMWNPDANNAKGIYILIEFDPEDDDNTAFNNGNRTYQYNLIQTDDDGVFTLSANDFSDMPAGAKIMLWVGRGNYNIIDGADGINKYSLYSYTIAFDSFVLGQ